MFLRFPAWCSITSLNHYSFSPVPDRPSDPTGTPSSSRPVWWRPWWLTWVWATSEWLWCPMTMETLWPWSCSSGMCMCQCIYVNCQKQSKMMNCWPPFPLCCYLFFYSSCTQTRTDQNSTGHLNQDWPKPPRTPHRWQCLSNGGTVQSVVFGHVVDLQHQSVISEAGKKMHLS